MKCAIAAAYSIFGLFETFKKVVGLQELIQEHTDIKRRHNCLYTAHEIIDTMVDAAALGLLRFSHMEALKQDPGYQTIKDRDTVPDERTLRYLLAKLTEKHVEQLRKVNDGTSFGRAVIALYTDLKKLLFLYCWGPYSEPHRNFLNFGLALSFSLKSYTYPFIEL